MIAKEVFEEYLQQFVSNYPKELWTINNNREGIYGERLRIQTDKVLNDLPVFANYYISYDQIFQVPMLSAYFYSSDGHQLTHDELLSLIQDFEKVDPGAITEGEHPILGIPVFFIHTCKTAEFIKPFLEHGANYFHVWLVRYGPLFFYYLPY